MAMRDACQDWRRFDAEKIPSKASTPHLDMFLAAVQKTAAENRPLTLLDVGCGTGRLGRRLYDRGFSVLGVDVNLMPFGAAQKLAVPADAPAAGCISRRQTSHRMKALDSTADLSTSSSASWCSQSSATPVSGRTFCVTCKQLRPGGWLYLSASGVSDAINAGYARLYAEDIHLTGERHSYLSRNEQGEVLYMTHHFTADELAKQLEAAGFDQINVTTEKESSSRRPDEAAYFHYATCRACR